VIIGMWWTLMYAGASFSRAKQGKPGEALRLFARATFVTFGPLERKMLNLPTLHQILDDLSDGDNVPCRRP